MKTKIQQHRMKQQRIDFIVIMHDMEPAEAPFRLLRNFYFPPQKLPFLYPIMPS